MHDENGLQIADQLIKRAKSGEHTTFEFIRSIEEYFAARTVRRVVNKVVKSFTDSRNNLYNAYVRSIENDTNDLNVILSISELNRVIEFYTDEINLISDMIDEYVAYVHSGHIMDTIMGNYRKEEDLVDFRKAEWFCGE